MTLEIRAVSPATQELAAALFEDLRADAATFHPHPLDRDEAARIAWREGRDVYLVGIVDGEKMRAAAYGILRGWDAGFDVPSLGVAVHPAFRGYGLGRLMVQALHCAAAILGAPAVRLKVYPDNIRAVRLYESLGYVWRPQLESGQRVGYFEIKERA